MGTLALSADERVKDVYLTDEILSVDLAGRSNHFSSYIVVSPSI